MNMSASDICACVNCVIKLAYPNIVGTGGFSERTSQYTISAFQAWTSISLNSFPATATATAPMKQMLI